jgi:hypothetical protein
MFFFFVARRRPRPVHLGQGLQATDVWDQGGAGKVLGQDLEEGREGRGEQGVGWRLRVVDAGNAERMDELAPRKKKWTHLLAAGVDLALQHDLVAGLGSRALPVCVEREKARRGGETTGGVGKGNGGAPGRHGAPRSKHPLSPSIHHALSLSLTICRPRSMPPHPEKREATRKRLPATMVNEGGSRVLLCVVVVRVGKRGAGPEHGVWRKTSE